MGYPQPPSSAPVLAAQNAFRLQTPLFGGDIYESEVGAQAFAIGPNSDVDTVAISYFDPANGPTFQSQYIITPNCPAYGSVFARLDPAAKYQPSGRQGRILIAPLNIWDPNQLTFANSIITPVLDVIQYFTQPPSIPARADKLFNIQNITIPSTGVTWRLAIPVYGRSFISTQFDCVGDDITYGISGVNLTINDGTPENQTVELVAPATAATVKFPIVASTQGKFDFIVFSFATMAVNEQFWSLKVVASDQSQ